MSDDVPMKRCSKCGEEKPATYDFFPRDKRSKDGWQYQCKICKCATVREYRSHPEVQKRYRAQLLEYAHRPEKQDQLRAYRREYARQPHVKERKRIAVMNHRALRMLAPGEVTAQDIRDTLKRQKSRCSLCQQRLVSYHVDHIIPLSRGGTNWPDNIQILCPVCNRAKQDKFPHEFFEGGKLL
jgi:5-methylcytosine-specific restriction endonuclease McrA